MTRSTDLKQAVGRLIIGKIAGTELSDAEAELLRQGIMGGVTLFKENAADLEQLAALVDDVYRHATLYPVIAVDQEGGAVQRFDHVITPLPSAMALGAVESPDLVKDTIRHGIRQLSLLGVNCLLWPVLDVASNPLNPVIGTRSYASSPDLVRALGMLTARLLRDDGMMAVGKHFPGHGDTEQDSHLLLAVNNSDAKALWERELVPFRACLNYLPAVMTGHIWLPAVDTEELPASLSPRVTSGLLRHYLGFDGVIFTDDLLMKGVTQRWGLEEAAVKAVQAGADQLLVCGSADEVLGVHRALTAAVESGEIYHSQLAASGRRLERARQETASCAERGAVRPSLAKRIELLRKTLDKGHELALATSVAAVTLLKGRVPAPESARWSIVAPEHPRYRLDLGAHLAQVLKTLGSKKKIELSVHRYPLNPTPEQIELVAGQAAGSYVIYLTYRTLLNRGQEGLGKALASASSQRLAVAVDTPYDCLVLPAWENCLATLDPSDLAMEALAHVLAGQAEPQGKCPVNL